MARGILDNFEISLAVLLPNTTTRHAITYTNTIGVRHKVRVFDALLSSADIIFNQQGSICFHFTCKSDRHSDVITLIIFHESR